MEATVAYLRALLCRDGVEQMRRDAELADAGLGAASPYRATMLHVIGLSYLLEGDAERADAEFAHAVDSASRSGSLPTIPVLLAERGIAAVDRDDWDAADGFAEQMLAMTQGGAVRRLLDERARVRVRGAGAAAARRPRAGASNSSPVPPGCARCSAMGYPSCRSRHCSRWRAPTSRSAIKVVPEPCFDRRATSSSNGRSWACCPISPPSYEPVSTRSAIGRRVRPR